MQNKEWEVKKVIQKIETLIYNFNNMEDHEKRILQAILSDPCWAELQHVSISLAECHVIDCIERNEQINATAIAKKLNITKGGISKITAKLIKKDLIELRRLENNQKETYYSLKPLGRKIFQVHKILHEKAAEKFTAILNQYSKEELQLAGRLLSDLTAVFRSTIAEQDRERQTGM
ncbi:MarR family winged helix-turn-helix transcriptional regulator [Acetonema longum]|uniref:MarR family transcriptional regulator n=1 Tax=Acetonema longum DSM 6540 TaxID=1009370 RepID=F7NKS8_9FIRM|nr:MarR family transcriptional regulator [Acetonema longum]EGO63382.1 MarR family transcriptional regulator [Acetonema longum DSM 6540]